MKDASVEQIVAKGIVEAAAMPMVEILTLVVAYLERLEARIRVIEDVIGVERSTP